MQKPQSDGAPLRHHLEVIRDRTGRVPRQLDEAPELPESVGYLWVWYLDICTYRPRGLTVEGLSPKMLMDWCWFTGNELCMWERKALRSLDVVMLKGDK